MTGDFLQVPNATVRDDRLSHMARGILAELLSRPDGWEANADDMWRASSAKHGKASPGRRGFRAAFAELKEYGYLTAGRELLGAGRHATVLTLSDVPQVGTSASPAETDKAPGHTDVPEGGTSVENTEMPHGGTSVPPGQTDVSAGRTDVPPTDVPHGGTSKEENGKKKTGLKTTTSPRTQAASSAPVADDPQQAFDMEEFGRFWLLHPKARDPDVTLTAWKAAVAKGVDPKKITATATAYAKEMAGEPIKYIKLSANWLRDGRYNDVFGPERPPAAPSGAPTHRTWSTEEYHSGFAS